LRCTLRRDAPGLPVRPVPEELQALRWPESEVVYVVASPEAPLYAQPSTLVPVTGSRIEVLREGPISEELITSAAERS
jgi:tRNA A37 threonylcarbamoyladenosine synthetase subunit TsaC/SUA5/YrdC